MSSLWTIGASTTRYPVLSGSLGADVVIIGGGITGLSTALQLADDGRRVVLLEACRIGRGNTGRSTGNLYSTLSQGLAPLRRKWNADVVRQVVELRSHAVDRIAQTVERFGIDCDFVRRPLYRLVASPRSERRHSIDEELTACMEAGLDCSLLDDMPALPFRLTRGLRIEQQAQFNPQHYCDGLAAALAAAGVQVLEESVVRDIDAGRGLVRTDDGEVQAGHIVFASHVPKGFNLVQAEMEPYREYGVAARLRGEGPPPGIFWVIDEQRSLRGYRHREQDHVVVVGEKHLVGHGDAGSGYNARLAEWLRARFDVEQMAFEWSAQQYRPADELPYIGPSAHGNVLMATGFAADGLVWGTVAARLLGERIAGVDRSGAADLLSPRRFTPLKSASVWAAENATVARHLVGDRLQAAEPLPLRDIARGEGRIVELDGAKRAVYRSEDNALLVLSPVCPHLKCHVHWNAAETSWDCPCHGSRFRPDGSIIEGPALQPLQRLALAGDGETRAPVSAGTPATAPGVGAALGRGSAGATGR